jgi:UDP-N-acetylglucosamine 2-epimerase (non-hydrolysing)
VNTTLACALVAAKFRRREPFCWDGGRRRSRPVIVHVEAGLRSFDDDMPEEVNRRITDTVSDLLFVTEPAGLDNLRREGVPDDRVFLVGNVMIDTLYAMRARAARSAIRERLGLSRRPFALLTLHRPSNVDDPDDLARLLGVLDEEVATRLPLVFPVHPRTRARLASLDALRPPRWLLVEPVGYLDFLSLQSEAKLVLTDSGGVQEETTVLGVPCVTLRDNTERPVTIAEGTNVLAGTTRAGIAAAVRAALDAPRAPRTPHLWDGRAAERVVRVLAERFAPAVVQDAATRA